MSSNATYTNGAASAVDERHRPSVFIAAPVSADTRVIRDSLRRRGFEAVTLGDLDAVGRSIPEVLKDSIERADLVVAVISDESTAPNIFYEIGFAQALGKRVLALSPSGLLPWASGIAYLRAEPSNREAIDFGLDQILAAPTRPSPQAPTDAAERTRPIGALTDELLAESRREGLTEGELVDIVLRALKASGVRVWAEPRLTEGGRGDLAVWSDDIEPWIKNPLVIDLKRKIESEAGLQNAISQMSKYLESTSADGGLIICQRLGVDPETRGRVLVVSLGQFLEALRNRGFGDYVVGLRTGRVHAGA